MYVDARKGGVDARRWVLEISRLLEDSYAYGGVELVLSVRQIMRSYRNVNREHTVLRQF